MHRYTYSLFAIYALCFASRDGVRAASVKLQEDATPTTEIKTGSILDCITCLSKQPQLNEMIQAQKVAQRLEYIKQQLMSNLHVETPPTNPPKLEALPGFMVEQLVNPEENYEEKRNRETVADAKQIVLVPKEGEYRMLVVILCTLD